MPMGIVSDSDFEIEKKRLIKEEPIPDIVSEVTVEDIKRGRGNTKEVPEIIRESVARAAINGNGTGKEIAEAFNISPSSVSAYKVGATSTTTYNEPDDDLLSTVVGHRKNVSRVARATLLEAIGNISPEKLSAAKARDLSAIAKDMSNIIVDMEPPVPAIQNQNNVQFVFMAPRVRTEDSYSVIEVPD